MTRRYSRITGTGSYLPPRRVTNDDLVAELAARGIETSDEWIVERTGIQARHFAAPDVPASELAVPAAQAALQAAGLQLPVVTLPELDELDHQNIIAAWKPEFAEMAVLRHGLRTQEQPRRAFQQVFEAAMGAWLAAAPDDARYRESWPRFQARSVQALQQMLRDSSGCGQVWAFTSGGPIAAICQHLLGMDNARTLGLSWTLANASITRILWPASAPERASIQTVNGFAHLEEKPGLLTWR